MANAREMVFTRLSDGTLLRREPDGSYRPVASESDRARLDALTDAEIERMAASDPDHPALDDAFWEAASAPAENAEAVTLDSDVLRYFRKEGRGYQNRINAVLRHYMRENERAG
ncbi:BrnA antitoxin family protein [Methylobacterium sp. NEAU 140]|uniref:BrnA antitoxin family protein n=1 Tax=Methylobacterium sp. NEAU 140 TaxID=3064945 RepID=UPI002734B23E|nr:BrnA antitoxin family protein [Methylobacterium sp. NEAU 140]MDP4025950.1 BrnA antitoxin family protein [Methylobacterium sp. NEAU 140]